MVGLVEQPRNSPQPVCGDEALPQVDLIRAVNTEALTLFDDADLGGRLEQRGMGAGIEPGKSSPHDFDRHLYLHEGRDGSER